MAEWSQSRPTATNRAPILSLFSGAGGLDFGFEQAGFDVLLALDRDPVAVDTYNWNRITRVAPARVLDLSASSAADCVIKLWHEVAASGVTPVGIVGGPPCQAFSVSNVHRIEDDPRARLPLSYAKVLKAVNEEFAVHFFVFENVAGLGMRTDSESLMAFLKAFSEAGFEVGHHYLDAAQFGVPQHRKRMFITGFNRTLWPNLLYKPPQGSDLLMTVRGAIEHLPEAMRFERSGDPRQRELHRNHWCMNPKSKKFGNGVGQPGNYLGRSFRTLHWDRPSTTVAYGHREVNVHPKGHRRLSVYEAMLLQGLPEDYELLGTLSDQFRLVSDLVPPPMALALASSIVMTLNHPLFDAQRQNPANGQLLQLGFDGLQAAPPRSTRA